MPGMAEQSKGNKAAIPVSGSNQPLTSIDDGIHLQLGDVTAEQGDLLVQLLVLLVLGLIHLHSYPWNRKGSGMFTRCASTEK